MRAIFILVKVTSTDTAECWFDSEGFLASLEVPLDIDAKWLT